MMKRLSLLSFFFALMVFSGCGVSGELKVDLDLDTDEITPFGDAPVNLTIENKTNQDLSQIVVTIPADFFEEAGGVEEANPSAEILEGEDGSITLTWDQELLQDETFEAEVMMWTASGTSEGTISICAPELEESCGEAELTLEVAAYDEAYWEDPIDLAGFEFTKNFPETASVGVPFDVSFSIKNISEEQVLFYSMDIGKNLMSTMDFDCEASTPACVEEPWEYDWNDYTYLTYEYLMDLNPGESIDMSFNFTPKEAGEYEFPFDLCLGEYGEDCDLNIFKLSVTD